MENANVIATKGGEVIFEMIKGRLLHQYRKKDWPKNLTKQITNEVWNQMDVVESFCKAEAANKYRNYIPTPKPTLGARLKFLFTGKLV